MPIILLMAVGYLLSSIFKVYYVTGRSTSSFAANFVHKTRAQASQCAHLGSYILSAAMVITSLSNPCSGKCEVSDTFSQFTPPILKEKIDMAESRIGPRLNNVSTTACSGLCVAEGELCVAFQVRNATEAMLSQCELLSTRSDVGTKTAEEWSVYNRMWECTESIKIYSTEMMVLSGLEAVTATSPKSGADGTYRIATDMLAGSRPVYVQDGNVTTDLFYMYWAPASAKPPSGAEICLPCRSDAGPCVVNNPEEAPCLPANSDTGACYVGSELRCNSQTCLPCATQSSGPCILGKAVCLTEAADGKCFTGTFKRCAAADAWIIVRGLNNIGVEDAGVAFLLGDATAVIPPPNISPQRWFYAEEGGGWKSHRDGANAIAINITTTAPSFTEDTSTTIMDTKVSTRTVPQCEQFTCVLHCEDSCGWDRLQGRCRAGLETSASERRERLGDCPPDAEVDSGVALGVGAALGSASFLAITAVILRRHRTSVQSARYAAVVRQSSQWVPAVPDTPRPQNSLYAGVFDTSPTYAEVGDPQHNNPDDNNNADFDNGEVTDYTGDAYTEPETSHGNYEEAQTLTPEYAIALQARESLMTRTITDYAHTNEKEATVNVNENPYVIESDDDFDV